jgi:hypothetical protein
MGQIEFLADTRLPLGVRIAPSENPLDAAES